MKKINATKRLKANIEDYFPGYLEQAFSNIIRSKNSAYSVIKECIRNYQEIFIDAGSDIKYDLYRLDDMIDEYCSFRRWYNKAIFDLDEIAIEDESGLLEIEIVLANSVKELLFTTMVTLGVEQGIAEDVVSKIKVTKLR